MTSLSTGESAGSRYIVRPAVGDDAAAGGNGGSGCRIYGFSPAGGRYASLPLLRSLIPAAVVIVVAAAIGTGATEALVCVGPGYTKGKCASGGYTGRCATKVCSSANAPGEMYVALAKVTEVPDAVDRCCCCCCCHCSCCCCCCCRCPGDMYRNGGDREGGGGRGTDDDDTSSDGCHPDGSISPASSGFRCAMLGRTEECVSGEINTSKSSAWSTPGSHKHSVSRMLAKRSLLQRRWLAR